MAFDLDGTLAEDDHLAPEVLAAIDAARDRGLRILVVTGRILSELRATFPELAAHVDAIVGENGAVTAVGVGSRRLAPAVPEALVASLRESGVTFRSGEVILAAAAADEGVVLDDLRRCGLDCALIRNRAELMVLPAGVTKGTGLRHALADLGLSLHNTIAVGDAENDHSMFDACELGAAVANAVPSLRAHADVRLAGSAGRGAIELLEGDLLAGRSTVHPGRWQLEVGLDEHLRPVLIPASQVNLLVAGGSGTGKSYLAGLLTEQLIGLGYSVVVIDPEGDHEGVTALPGVWAARAAAELPGPSEVARLLRSDQSLVIDLSTLDPAGRAHYLDRLPAEIQAQRSVSGRPQWIVLDEAQSTLGPGAAGQRAFEPSNKGHLVVTWQPARLSADTAAGLDIVVGMAGPEVPDGLVDLAASVGDLPRATVADALDAPPGHAILVRRDHPRELVTFTVGARMTQHVRHEHKYSVSEPPPERCFYFRSAGGTPTGAVARNLRDLEGELAGCGHQVLRHHCLHKDLSRWTREVLCDPLVADQLSTVEDRISATCQGEALDAGRMQLLRILQSRRPYLMGPA